MNSKIITLDEQLCNLIAAGEVVERPSSIVKELVENAIDAQSKQIIVKIKNGGLDEIIVSDDGEGMDKNDIKLAFLPNSTSKIANAHDLNHLTTLGFRGEALAAIGAVSHCEIVTNNGEQGYGIINEFGEIGEVSYEARNPGTTVTVRELFYQSPNRLKFLKTVDYETALISDLLQKFALSYLDISWQYFNNDRIVFNSPGNNDIRELLFNIYGSSIYQHLLEFKIEDFDFSLSGYISDSHYSRRNKTGINIFINHRLINSAILTKTIVNAYGDHLPKGKYPLAVINITTDPQLTDVNVSPTKWQIRISKERDLTNLLIRGVKEVLYQENKAQLSTIFDVPVRQPSTLTNNPELKEDKLIYQQLQLEESPVLKEEAMVIVHQPTLIGQIFGKYILADFHDELWLIDQHAAMERCNYEKFRKALLEENHPQQVIDLSPLEVSLAHLQRLPAINEQLAPLGIQFEEYGINKLLVRSIPLWISQVDVESLLYDLLEYTLHNEEVNIAELRKATLASLACHSSIKFNEYLSRDAQLSLINELLSCENPYHCPHGRPTIVKLTDQQLAKEFERA